jgi:uncharacterized protein YndB with AHSA1/START domain
MARSAEATVTIEAPPEVVWGVMLDLDRYPDWNPFVVQVDGPAGRPAAVGDELVLHVRWASGRGVTTHERITRLEPPGAGGRATLEYDFGGPLATLGLVRGRRLQEIDEGPAGSTRYRTAERLHGLLAVAAPIGRVQDGFERHAAALKARAEAVHAGTA